MIEREEDIAQFKRITEGYPALPQAPEHRQALTEMLTNAFIVAYDFGTSLDRKLALSYSTTNPQAEAVEEPILLCALLSEVFARGLDASFVRKFGDPEQWNQQQSTDSLKLTTSTELSTSTPPTEQPC